MRIYSLPGCRDGVKPSQFVDTIDRQDVQPLSPPNTAVQHIEGTSTVPSNSSACKESIKLHINLENIGTDVVGDTDSSPVAKVDSRTKQYTK